MLLLKNCPFIVVIVIVTIIAMTTTNKGQFFNNKTVTVPTTIKKGWLLPLFCSMAVCCHSLFHLFCCCFNGCLLFCCGFNGCYSAVASMGSLFVFDGCLNGCVVGMVVDACLTCCQWLLEGCCWTMVDNNNNNDTDNDSNDNAGVCKINGGFAIVVC